MMSDSIRNPSRSRPGSYGLWPQGKVVCQWLLAQQNRLGEVAPFEFQLLLTQAEALSYGLHLAQVAAENEPQTERAREFSSLSAELEQLYEQVLALLRKKGQAEPR